MGKETEMMDASLYNVNMRLTLAQYELQQAAALVNYLNNNLMRDMDAILHPRHDPPLEVVLDTEGPIFGYDY